MYKAKQKNDGSDVLYFKRSVFICVIYIILQEMDLLRICYLLQDDSLWMVNEKMLWCESICNFKQSTCTLIFWHVWSRNHMKNIEVPWFFKCFYAFCDFSYILHVARYTLLWSNSMNENLCLRKRLIVTKWCLVLVIGFIMEH